MPNKPHLRALCQQLKAKLGWIAASSRDPDAVRMRKTLKALQADGWCKPKRRRRKAK